MTDTSIKAESGEMYVGYLPVPQRLRGFLRMAVPMMFGFVCAASVLWGYSQRTPGTGVWDTDRLARLRGVIVTEPYPVLFTESSQGAKSAVLLVESGKRGSNERLAGMDGRVIAVTGWTLQRDGRQMLELAPDDGAVVAESEGQSSAGMSAPRPTLLGRVTLRGEIVDSKCFLGAMKPGEGKTHKECATLCIRGGIPPLFVTRDSAGSVKYYLLQDAAGGPIDPAVYPLIADPVEVSGEWWSWGGLDVLRVRSASVRRL